MAIQILTKRELEVTKLVATGASNREIGETLSVSEHTINHYLNHVFQKLKVTNRVQLTLWALSTGFAELPDVSDLLDF